MIDKIWFEKYRPTKFDDMILPKSLLDKFNTFVKKDEIPNHLLLHGLPGGGKTTVAKILVNTLNCSYLFINASDENGIDTIRNKIKSFVSTFSMSKTKIVILDEADFISPSAQAMLRSVLEEFSSVSRFILTCNYKSKIIDPIKSRCSQIEITPVDSDIAEAKKLIAKRVLTILNTEGIEYDIHDVAEIIDSYFPDFRRIINELQSNCESGKLNISKKLESASDDNPINFIVRTFQTTKNGNHILSTIRQYIADNGIRTFNDLYSQLYQNLNELFNKEECIPDAIVIIAEGQYQDAFVIDKEITFMATISKLTTIG